jgi:electron transfer flavoprotein beta subunit
MRIVVCVKQVYDPKTVKISRSREEFDLRDAAKILNPADKYALEAALRLREAVGGEVISLTIGDAGAEDVGREAVAIGANKAILVTGGWKLETAASASSFQLLASNAVTKLIVAAVARLGDVDLVVTGEMGATDGTGGLAPRLAAALGWPVNLDVVRLGHESGGLQAIMADGAAGDLATPAVVAVIPGLVRPRYPHPARIANAWNDGLMELLTATDLGLTADSLTPDAEPGGLILGPERVRGQVIGGTLAEAAGAVMGMMQAKRVI